MTQADFTSADNGPGQIVRSSINTIAEAALTANSGDTPPPATLPGMPWNMFATIYGRPVRSADNTMWLYFDTYGHTEPPGSLMNEASGYPPGAHASLLDGGTYLHEGGGQWVRLGAAGTGGSGGFAGQVVFDMGYRFAPSDDPAPVVVIDMGERFEGAS